MSAIQPTTDALCLRCGPTEAAASQGDEVCFSLAPQAHGELHALQAQSMAFSDSVAVTYAYDLETGNAQATLHTISYVGQPVTTATIQTLCGGQAPYLWRNKRIEITHASNVIPMDGAMLMTTDGAIYGFNTADTAFDYHGPRVLAPAVYAYWNAMQEDLATVYREWIHGDGLLCALSTSRADETPAMRDADGPQPLLPHRVVANAPYEVPRHLRTLADEAPAVIQSVFQKIVARYLAVDDEPVRVRFIPVLMHSVFAWYDPVERHITVSLDLMNTPEYQAATLSDREMLLGYILAHEIGHHRHHTRAGLQETAVSELVHTYGVPLTVAYALATLLQQSSVPQACGEHFLSTLNGFGATDVLVGHAPGHGEVIADMYAADFLTKEERWMGADMRRFLFRSHADRRAMERRELASHYAKFPLAAVELSWLYSAAQLDPHLPRASQLVDMRFAVQIGELLPRGTENTIGSDVPVASVGPAESAALTLTEMQSLEHDALYFEAVTRQR